MDLSRIPKRSDTQEHEPASAPPPANTPTADAPAPPIDYRRRSINDPELGPDIWMNSIIGLLMIGMGFTFARFGLAKLTGQPFHSNVNWVVGLKAGQEVAYFDLEGFTAWTEMGMFLFGLVLLLEAASKAAAVMRPGSASRALLVCALALTAGTMGLNLFISVKLLSVGMIPYMSGLAVAFGGWILANEWRMLRSDRAGMQAG